MIELARATRAGFVPPLPRWSCRGDPQKLVARYADPAIAGTVHLVEGDAEDIQLRLESRHRPSATNPRTSRAVAPSLLAAPRALLSPVQVGS